MTSSSFLSQSQVGQVHCSPSYIAISGEPKNSSADSEETGPGHNMSFKHGNGMGGEGKSTKIQTQPRTTKPHFQPSIEKTIRITTVTDLSFQSTDFCSKQSPQQGNPNPMTTFPIISDFTDPKNSSSCTQKERRVAPISPTTNNHNINHTNNLKDCSTKRQADSISHCPPATSSASLDTTSFRDRSDSKSSQMSANSSSSLSSSHNASSLASFFPSPFHSKASSLSIVTSPHPNSNAKRLDVYISPQYSEQHPSANSQTSLPNPTVLDYFNDRDSPQSGYLQQPQHHSSLPLYQERTKKRSSSTGNVMSISNLVLQDVDIFKTSDPSKFPPVYNSNSHQHRQFITPMHNHISTRSKKPDCNQNPTTIHHYTFSNGTSGESNSIKATQSKVDALQPGKVSNIRRRSHPYHDYQAQPSMRHNVMTLKSNNFVSICHDQLTLPENNLSSQLSSQPLPTHSSSSVLTMSPLTPETTPTLIHAALPQSAKKSTVTINPKNFKCPLDLCESVFTRRYNMVTHFRTHALKLGFVCELTL
jgi:hypothetical protein